MHVAESGVLRWGKRTTCVSNLFRVYDFDLGRVKWTPNDVRQCSYAPWMSWLLSLLRFRWWGVRLRKGEIRQGITMEWRGLLMPQAALPLGGLLTPTIPEGICKYKYLQMETWWPQRSPIYSGRMSENA